MHDPDNIPLEQFRIYEDGELVYDSSDPDTYTYATGEELEAALRAGPDEEDR